MSFNSNPCLDALGYNSDGILYESFSRCASALRTVMSRKCRAKSECGNLYTRGLKKDDLRLSGNKGELVTKRF